MVRWSDGIIVVKGCGRLWKVVEGSNFPVKYEVNCGYGSDVVVVLLWLGDVVVCGGVHLDMSEIMVV